MMDEHKHHGIVKQFVNQLYTELSLHSTYDDIYT
jgi:hypothetical protein